MTEAEYLEYDRTHDGKYEYVNGEVVAMSGVSDAHDRIQVNATFIPPRGSHWSAAEAFGHVRPKQDHPL